MRREVREKNGEGQDDWYPSDLNLLHPIFSIVSTFDKDLIFTLCV